MVTVVFGVGAIYLAYQQRGWNSLHGVWLAAGVLGLYFAVQDYFRMRRTLQSLVGSAVPMRGQEVVRFQTGSNPNSLDFLFAPAADAEKDIGPEPCTTTVIDDVVKVERPATKGRYIATILYYEAGSLIPTRNALNRVFLVRFECKTSGPKFRLGIRLRNRKGEWQKDPQGGHCLIQVEVSSIDWTPSPKILLIPGTPQQEFKVSIELLPDGEQPGPDASLFLRRVVIVEEF